MENKFKQELNLKKNNNLISLMVKLENRNKLKKIHTYIN